MADNNKKDSSSGSFLRTAILAAPTAAGIGYAIQQHRSSMLDASVNPTSTIDTTRGLLSTLDNKARYERLQNKLTKIMSSKYTQTPEGIKKLKEAWKVALLTSGSSSGKLGSTLSSLHSLEDTEFLSALSGLGQQTSRYSWNVVDKFTKAINDVADVSDLNLIIAKDFMLSSTSSRHSTKKFKHVAPLLKQYFGKYSALFQSIPEVAGSDFGYHSITAKIDNEFVKFNLPSSVGGTIMEGMTLTNRAIAPDIGLVSSTGIETMSREEFFVKQIGETIVPKIKSKELKGRNIDRAISSIYQNIYSDLESVPNMLSGSPSGLKDYIKFRRSALDLYTVDSSKKAEAAYRRLNLSETLSTLEQHGEAYQLFAGTGAEAFAQGRVQTQNAALSTLFPEAVDWSRKPEALIRPWNLTKKSRQALADTKGEHFGNIIEKNLLPGFRNQGISALTLYDTVENLGGEGIFFMKQSTTDKLEFEIAHTEKIKAFNDPKSADDFIQRMMGGKVKAGEFLGVSQTGARIDMPADTVITGARKTSTTSTGDQITLEMITNYRMKNNEKWFHDIKGLSQILNDSAFESRATRRINSELLAKNLQTIAAINDLKKDPAKFAKQMFTGMHYLHTENMNNLSGKNFHTLSDKYFRSFSQTQIDFFKDPSSFLEAFTSMGKTNNSWNNEAITREMMQFAVNELNMGPKDIGLIFGSAPSVIGKESTEKIMRQVLDVPDNAPDIFNEFVSPYMSEILKGRAIGLSRVNWGGPEELTGAGAMGSLEPRVFDVFAGPAFTGWNKEIAGEMATRLHATNPEKQAASTELWKTIQSLSGEISPEPSPSLFKAADYDATNLKQAFSQRLNQSGSFWIDPGHGIKPIYVPDVDNFKRMQTLSMVGEKEITGDVAKHYYEMLDAISPLYSSVEPANLEEVKTNLTSIKKDLQSQWAPMGKGAGSIFRGKVLGSRFARGVDVVNGYRPPDPYTMGVTDELFNKMFNEMKQSNLYNATELDSLDEMAARFHNDERIGSMLMRHPVIGPYSAQPMAMQRIKGKGLQIALPEFRQQITTAAGENIDLTLGPLVGLAGDKDADIYASFLLSPQLEQQSLAITHGTDASFRNRYAQHQVRYQFLKAKQAKNLTEEFTSLTKMVTGAHKLAVVPEWVPRLSTRMTEAKQAVLNFSTGTQQADALAMLEWAEQTPIGGKHLSEKEVASGGISTQLTQMLSALEENRGQDLEEIYTSLLKNNPTGQQLLSEDLQITEKSAQNLSRTLNAKIGTTLKSFNIKDTVQTITQAQQQYRDSGGARTAEIFSARGRSISSKEVASMTTDSTPGAMKSAVAEMLAMQNQAVKTGKEIISKYKKPLTIGIAGSLALGALIAKPQNLMGSAKGASPQANLRAPSNNGINGAESEPTGYRPSIGSPTTPRPILPSPARISPPINEQTNVKHLQLTSSADSKRYIHNMQRQGSKNSKISINLRDSRNQLSENYHANKPD